MSYQLKAMQPFEFRGVPVAVDDLLTFEDADHEYAEHLTQAGKVCRVTSEAGGDDQGGAVQPLKSTDNGAPARPRAK